MENVNFKRYSSCSQKAHHVEQAMITLQELAVFNSLYGLKVAKLIY